MTGDILIRSYLKRLRLPYIAQHYSRLAREAAVRNQPYQDYLLALLESEVLQQEEHAQKLRLSKAHFPVLKTLDSFDFSAIPSLNRALILELSRGSYIDRRENVIFIGSYGTGKTHLAISLGVCACRQGKRVRFYTTANLSNKLLEAQSQLRLSKLEASLARCDLIILDELGFIPFSREIFGDEALTGALLDCLTHHCHIIEVNGDRYRFRESLRRKEKVMV